MVLKKDFIEDEDPMSSLAYWIELGGEAWMPRSLPARDVAMMFRGEVCWVLARSWMMPWPMPRFEPVTTMVRFFDILVAIGSFSITDVCLFLESLEVSVPL